MVRLVLLVCLLLSGVTLAERIKIYPAEPMLGQAVILSMPADMHFIEQKFNWVALERCFAVFKADYGSERVRFTLYPYRAGKCEIKRSPWETWEVPSYFNVRPNPDVQVHWQPPKPKVFVREAIHWQAKVTLSGESGYKAWLETPDKVKLSYRFSPSVQGVLHAVGFSERAGEQILYAPMVTVKNPSGQLWRFPAAQVEVVVRPLPAYLPANIAVGKMHAFSETLPWLVEHRALTRLSWSISGHNVSPDWLPDPRLYRPVSEQFRWLIAEQKNIISWDRQGMRIEQRWQQPVQWSNYGDVRLPAVRMFYFDPEEEKLRNIWLPAQTVWVLPRPVLWGIYGLGGVVLFSLIGAILWLIWQWGWYMWLSHHRDQSPLQLWHAMLVYSRWRSPWRRAHKPQTPMEWLLQQPAYIRRTWHPVITKLNESLFSH